MILREEIDIMAEVIHYLREQGYSTEFTLAPEGLKDSQTDKLYKPEEFTLKRVFRFEGKGKQRSLDALYALQSKDGKRGWIATDSRKDHAPKQLEKLLPKVQSFDSYHI